MTNKGKKLSLEEARALFSDNSAPRRKPRKSNKYKNYSGHDPKVDQRISQLERQIMEGNLSEKEEQRILKEIGKLENQTR